MHINLDSIKQFFNVDMMVKSEFYKLKPPVYENDY